MTSISFIFVCLTLPSTYAVASGRLQHAVALVGHNALFNCNTTVPASQILWDHKSAITAHSSKLMDGLSVKDNRSGRVVVDHTPTDISGSRLFIGDIQLTDAGTYSCINSHTGETQLTAELTVVADVPSCYMNIASSKYIVEENDDVLVTCNISSYGILFPNVTCDSDANQTRIVKAGFPSDHKQLVSAGSMSDNKSYTCYRWNVKATTATHGSRVECSVWFEYQQETLYSSTWMSPNISVAYGPHSVTIHPQNQTVFEDGDRLECAAEGNPQPQYHWTVGNVVENGQNLTVDVCKFVVTLGDTPSTRVVVKCIADRDTRTATTTREIELTVNDTQRQLCAPTPSHRTSALSEVIYLTVMAVLFGITTMAVLGYIRKSYGSRRYTLSVQEHQQPDLIVNPDDYRSATQCLLERDAVVEYSEVGGGSDVIAGYSEVACSSAPPVHEFQPVGCREAYAEVVPPSQRHGRTQDNDEQCTLRQSGEKENSSSLSNLLHQL